MKLYIEIIIQTVLAFFTILFIARLLGRQQISQLTFYEYINGITFGSIAGNMATNTSQNTFGHFIGLVLFGILTFLLSHISLKKRAFRKVVEGEPILVIQDGKILEKKLKSLRYSIDELNILLRQRNVFTPEDVKYGILESNGNLSLILQENKRLITIKDLNIKPKERESIHTELIIGGQLIYENLKKRKITGSDLMKKLNKENINKINEIMYATIDDEGKLYIDKYSDDLKKSIDFSEDNQNV